MENHLFVLDDIINQNIIKKIKKSKFLYLWNKSKSNFLIKNIKQKKKFSEFDLQVNVPNKKKL